MSDWGRAFISYGCALLGYEWLYVPIMRGWEMEPWTATRVGWVTLACGCVLFAIHEFRAARQPEGGGA